MIPEFLGRIPVIAKFNQLDKKALARILMEPQNSIMARYKALFRADGVALEINDDALESICEKAMQKNTGARGS